MGRGARRGAKGYSDTYLKQHPEHGDAYFTLGLYNYYADIAPAYVRILRLLLFLPAGDRTEGLKQLERAESQGSLFAPRAGLVLIELYSTFEGRIADAQAMGERLKRAYPQSDDVDFEVAQIYSSPSVEDLARAARLYQAIIDRRKHDQSLDGATSHYNALLSLASTQFDQWRLEEAIGVLTSVIEMRVTSPEWVMPQMLLRRSNYRALVNDPAAAEDARRVLADPKWSRFHQGATNVLKFIDDRTVSGEAAIYAAAIPANRLISEERFDEARVVFDKLRAQYPNSPLIQYRQAYLDFVSGHSERALSAFSALANNKAVPETLRSMSLLYVGRAHDLAGRREEAKKTYDKVIDDYEKTRAAGPARVGLVSPYRRPVRTT